MLAQATSPDRTPVQAQYTTSSSCPSELSVVVEIACRLNGRVPAGEWPTATCPDDKCEFVPGSDQSDVYFVCSHCMILHVCGPDGCDASAETAAGLVVCRRTRRVRHCTVVRSFSETQQSSFSHAPGVRRPRDWQPHSIAVVSGSRASRESAEWHVHSVIASGVDACAAQHGVTDPDLCATVVAVAMRLWNLFVSVERRVTSKQLRRQGASTYAPADHAVLIAHAVLDASDSRIHDIRGGRQNQRLHPRIARAVGDSTPSNFVRRQACYTQPHKTFRLVLSHAYDAEIDDCLRAVRRIAIGAAHVVWRPEEDEDGQLAGRGGR